MTIINAKAGGIELHYQDVLEESVKWLECLGL